MGTSDALLASSSSLLSRTRVHNDFSGAGTSSRHNSLFAAGNSEADIATVDEMCGDGFYKETGPDGDYCVFNYESAARAFGTGEQVVNEDEWEALEIQNQARKKFGLKPLTPEQYVALQAQIHQMESQQMVDATEKAFSEFDTNKDGVITLQELKEGLENIIGTDLSEKRVEKVMQNLDSSGDGLLQPDEFLTVGQLRNVLDAVATPECEQPQSKAQSSLQNFINNVFQDTCECNFDCDQPEVCCDFGFKKMCCFSGRTAQNLEYATVPVPSTFS
eukprot:CAMPEP_0198143304 /NCGR_PEP_ID=MMETSP1443-20131203/6275_1 /TAXON_ID=186043 /ORGANISM="Entomoneis sp., Strain CCMP2396" /LENGTH=274 /DNA_ID=CAMNT_0043806525 /DNA_START=71 /DNA_END=895 /DNA_ORIENTATION=+